MNEDDIVTVDEVAFRVLEWHMEGDMFIVDKAEAISATPSGLIHYLDERGECPHGTDAFDVLCCPRCAPILTSK